MRDLGRDTEDIEWVLARMAELEADVWVLQDFDYDFESLALSAFAARAGFEHFFAAAPNTGVQTGIDLDGDGQLRGPRDAHGYGWFSGQGGLAILSRYPLTLLEDASDLIWAELPWATLPEDFYSPEALAVLRLSHTAHWRIQVEAPEPFELLTAYPTTPVFDGPEDRNGLRNADELRLLMQMAGRAKGPFVIAGDLNLDPERGEGRREEIAGLLSSGLVKDTLPGRHTADFGEDSAGKLRVSYVLPSPHWRVIDAGIAEAEAPSSRDVLFTRHHPVWVDLVLDSGG
ncbi:MAG: endonuclease/exonuclease/phosphatase family protein [Pseudomonadota bacterium]